ncbi:MAG: hypothetical protein HGB08_02940 [Candidatus Moranbacteria bacterium]|nr:hypothetical protein [Candidatus Moranbacteria bacterium]
MKFFKQTEENTCNIIAIQHVLSFFGKYPSFEEIKKGLPKHAFGDFLQEIGVYFDKMGIRTALISNRDYSKGKSFTKTLNEYRRREDFEDRLPAEKDIKDKPVIVNVDASKIRGERGDPGPHYVVLLREGGEIYLYDGANFDRKIKTSFEEILKASVDINKSDEDGMWLFLK